MCDPQGVIILQFDRLIVTAPSQSIVYSDNCLLQQYNPSLVLDGIQSLGPDKQNFLLIIVIIFLSIIRKIVGRKLHKHMYMEAEKKNALRLKKFLLSYKTTTSPRIAGPIWTRLPPIDQFFDQPDCRPESPPIAPLF